MKSHAALVRCSVIVAAFASGLTAAQDWKPQRNVEIVVTTSPGGSNDATARALERILTAHKLVSASLTVVNKPGGGGGIAYAYVNQRAGDGHTLLLGSGTLLSATIMGRSQVSYTDFTPIISLWNDYVVFGVNAGSPIKTGGELVERLKKDPQSTTIGFAAAFGNHHHTTAGLLMKAIGGNPRDLKIVVFKGASEAVPAVLGGHIDLVSTSAVNVHAHVAAGKIRLLGVAAPQRFGGGLAHVPTWKEQGFDVVYGSWRALMGPKGLSAAQVAYWENAVRKATETAEWKKDLETNYWSSYVLTGAQLRKALDKEYADMKVVLGEIGLAK
ncbi:MAG TPA: tripartite tricarboxylate transporter substrate binding protein [Burkholderiales bacterium]|nr:tripartite tricarboxylate transporter substrate binding protein [Burkholderiales bacterium]